VDDNFNPTLPKRTATVKENPVDKTNSFARLPPHLERKTDKNKTSGNG
jgi:hypothetical protein